MVALIFCFVLVELCMLGSVHGVRNPLSCSVQARHLTEFQIGGLLRSVCSPGCSRNNVAIKGSREYTDDSSICKAAIHAGVINDNGGPVQVVRLPGKSRYPSTVHNGITSQSFGSWTHSKSFTFVFNSCVRPLGIRSQEFRDDNFAASSVFRIRDWRFLGRTTYWHAHLARLDSASLVNAWRPENGDKNPWWQVDLGKIYDVRGIITQGSSRYGKAQYITSYKIQYKLTNDLEWEHVLNEKGVARVFKGNSDNNGRVTNNFIPKLTARYLRLLPVTWQNYISLRAEIMVCDIDRA